MACGCFEVTSVLFFTSNVGNLPCLVCLTAPKFVAWLSVVGRIKYCRCWAIGKGILRWRFRGRTRRSRAQDQLLRDEIAVKAIDLLTQGACGVKFCLGHGSVVIGTCCCGLCTMVGGAEDILGHHVH